jgi:biopolymer transport protein ExbB/TolQ
MNAVVAIVGAVFTALLGYFGLRYTAKSSKQAQELAAMRSMEQERLKVESDAYKRARDNYDAALDTMQSEIDALKDGRSYDRTEHSRQIEDLRVRVRELEQAQIEAHVRVTTLVAYTRVLIQLLRDNKITYPAPPSDLH